MTDMDDFGFDEEMPEEEAQDWEPEIEEKKGGGRTRVLLLALLLVILVAAALWFFVLAPVDGPSSPVQVVTMPKKPVAMPAPPAAAPAKAAPSAAAPMPAASTAPPSATAPAPTPMPASPAPTSASAPQPATEPPVTTVAVPPAPVAVPAAPEKPTASAKMAASAKPAAAVHGAYTLNAGSFLLDSSIKEVVAKVRAAGYEPVLTPVTRKVHMTRLRVGVYPTAVDAARKLKEVKRYAPDAFSIDKGGMVAVYAGSYFVRDKARAFADRLYEKRGVRLEEEGIEIKETLQRVTFGDFSGLDAATAEAKKLAARGLPAEPKANL